MRHRAQRSAATVLAVLVLLIGLAPSAGAHAPGLDGDQIGSSMSEKLAQNEPRLAASAAVTPPTITPECPPTIRCIVVPAAFTAIGDDVTNYGNYDVTDRPRDMKITSINIHDGEGTCQEILDAFKNPLHYAATHYVVCKDGTVYQMVRTQDMPWHAGNWYFNMHQIGIEHEGHSATGGTDYTTALYRSSSELVKYLTGRFGISCDRDHILGHDNIPAVKASQIAGMHTDPGPYWNWQLYMAMTCGPAVPSGGLNSNFVTVAPIWWLNKQSVTGCSVGNNGCAPEGPHSANFVYLRSEPRSDAPYFTDPVLGQGSTEITNNAARLFYGQTFAVADKKFDTSGMWYKVWVNGSTGWLLSPWNAPAALPATGKYIAPKAGQTSIPVYGRPVPEQSAYPTDLLSTPPASFWIPTLAPQAPLPYNVLAGQRYRVIDAGPVNDHFYAWAIDSSYPYDHQVFPGKTRFIEIQYGNRIGFVKADDVVIR